VKKKRGVVYLGGAGPGDPELITVRGKRLLETCDTVVYDALVNDLLVVTLPDTVKRIFVGKRGGKPSASQDEINRILVSEARKGSSVVRLKGGDPLVFGRGSEEMEYLASHGVRYEVVCGITSAIAAPGFAAIPVTHRTVSRSFAVVTGHLRAGESVDALDIPVADTLVFLMAMENLPAIVERLIARGAGFTRRTPAALIRNGSLPDQQTLVGTLGTIVKLRDRCALTPPAIFIVGETVRFASQLKWRRRCPLDGCRVAVLRTTEQSAELYDTLAKRGATVVPCPILRIVPRVSALRRITPTFLEKFTMVIFTSPNGARLFMERLLGRGGGDARSLCGKRVVALGGGTAATLLGYGIRVDAVPEKFVAEKLCEILPGDLSGEKILIPRAATAREVLPQTLRERGAGVTVLPVYDTKKNSAAGQALCDGDYVLFTSSSTVEYFYEDPARSALRIIPCCIGDITAATLRKRFAAEIYVAENATMPSLVETLERAVRAENRRALGRRS